MSSDRGHPNTIEKALKAFVQTIQDRTVLPRQDTLFERLVGTMDREQGDPKFKLDLKEIRDVDESFHLELFDSPDEHLREIRDLVKAKDAGKSFLVYNFHDDVETRPVTPKSLPQLAAYQVSNKSHANNPSPNELPYEVENSSEEYSRASELSEVEVKMGWSRLSSSRLDNEVRLLTNPTESGVGRWYRAGTSETLSARCLDKQPTPQFPNCKLTKSMYKIPLTKCQVSHQYIPAEEGHFYNQIVTTSENIGDMDEGLSPVSSLASLGSLSQGSGQAPLLASQKKIFRRGLH